jgi:hypothetical protein
MESKKVIINLKDGSTCEYTPFDLGEEKLEPIKSGWMLTGGLTFDNLKDCLEARKEILKKKKIKDLLFES